MAVAKKTLEKYEKPKEFLRLLSRETLDRAHGEHKSLSTYLEDQDGLNSEEYQDGMDALERMLYVSGLRVNSIPSEGAYADRIEDFQKSEHGRVLFSETIGRKWRAVSMPRQRSVHTSGDYTAGQLGRPYVDAMTPRYDVRIEAAIPLSELVAVTTPISGSEYRSYYITDDPANQRKVRVGEAAPVPKAKLTQAEHVVQMYKFGRSLESSYEALRRMRIDRLAIHIQKMAVQTEVDQVAAALDVMVNGDGNANTTPTSYNLTTLDSGASAGTLTTKGWLAFKMKFVNPYVLTSALMRDNVALQLALLNVGSANVPLMGLNLGGMTQALTPINTTSDGVRYGWTSDAPALKIIAFDRRFALERVVEVGSEISEVMRWINRQTEELVMTMNEGYASNEAAGVKILDVNA